MVLITSAVLIALLHCLGSCGYIKKCHIVICILSLPIIFLFVIELGIGIYIYTRREHFHSDIEGILKKAIKESYGEGSVGAIIGVDYIQNHLQCCGINRPTDWLLSKWYLDNLNSSKAEILVPASCCVDPNVEKCNEGYFVTLILHFKGTIFTKGCVKKATEFCDANLWKIVGISGIIEFVQVVLICILLSYCCRRNKSS